MKKRDQREPRYILIWKDGRRTEIKGAGGNYHIVPRFVSETGRIVETRFDCAEWDEDAHAILYREGATVDVTALMRENEAREANRKDVERGYRMPMFALELKGMYPGETETEFQRRIALRQGLDPDAASQRHGTTDEDK